MRGKTLILTFILTISQVSEYCEHFVILWWENPKPSKQVYFILKRSPTYPFISLGGERHGESKCLVERKQHYDRVPGQGSNPDLFTCGAARWLQSVSPNVMKRTNMLQACYVFSGKQYWVLSRWKSVHENCFWWLLLPVMSDRIWRSGTTANTRP